MRKTWFVVFGVFALGACREIAEPGVCPAILAPSARVTVLDSISGANITPGASAILRNATVADSVMAPEGSPVTVMGVGEGRVGTFTLTVRKPGYQAWIKRNLKVENGRCGAQTVDVTARLKPAG
jgi:hypothetical protein